LASSSTSLLIIDYTASSDSIERRGSKYNPKEISDKRFCTCFFYGKSSKEDMIQTGRVSTVKNLLFRQVGWHSTTQRVTELIIPIHPVVKRHGRDLCPRALE
jgi:hypothetical protein